MIVLSASTTPTATLQEKVQLIAHEYQVASSTITAIVDSETGGTWNTEQVCDEGDGRGLACINKRWFPEEFEKALDPDFSLRFIAKAIQEDKEYALFTSCSCISGARLLGAKVPKVKNADDIEPNTNYPQVKGLVLFDYNHIAVVRKVTKDGILVKEANFNKCRFSERWVDWDDKKIRGYWYNPALDG